ncbi:MAG: DUF169 domain-containing protein [Candidatus Bathyarchaeia archaeon]
MRQLSSDLSILKKFEFKYSPVGVKFLFRKPDGIEQLNKTLPFCQMIREAQERGTPFYFTKENEDCFGKSVLGMEDTPIFAEAGIIGEKFEIFEEARANKRIYQYVPKLPRGTVNYVAFSAIDTLTYEPDLLILMATPSQAEIVLRALSYSTGELWESKTTPVLGCAWIYIYPYLSGKINYIVTGMTFGMKSKEIYPEGWILITIPWDRMPIIIQNLKKMKWILPSYIEGREKFYERKARVIEECIEESQNP